MDRTEQLCHTTRTLEMGKRRTDRRILENIRIIFLKNKTGVFAAALLILMVLFCLFGQYLRRSVNTGAESAVKNMFRRQNTVGTVTWKRSYCEVCKANSFHIK